MNRNLRPARTATSVIAVVTFLGCALTALSVRAQFTVDPLQKFAWNENLGWMNWRDSGLPAGSHGASGSGTFMSGLVWCENAGYLQLGDGSPVNGSTYSNQSAADSGVNILPDHRLGGLAWGENVGWVNFGPFASLPGAQQARLDLAAMRLRGFAWGENVGWINLDSSDHFVAVICAADFNSDRVVDFFDYLDFVVAFAANAAASDFNHDGSIDLFDYLDFLNAFSSGC